MAGDSGMSFPVAGLAVVALFLSTAFLAPRGFDLLRQAESAAGPHVPLSHPGVEARCQAGQPETRATFRTKIPHGGLTVIAAMLPGATFVGSEEARRRSRYAVLAGLNVAGYVPDNSERMSLLRLPRCESFSGCPSEGDQGQNKGKDQKTANLVASATNDASPTSGNAAAPTPAMMDLVYETFTAAPNGPGDAGTPQR